jgi:hypothetical protein
MPSVAVATLDTLNSVICCHFVDQPLLAKLIGIDLLSHAAISKTAALETYHALSESPVLCGYPYYRDLEILQLALRDAHCSSICSQHSILHRQGIEPCSSRSNHGDFDSG